MGEKFKNSKIYKKLKEIRLTKTFYVSAITIVLALTIVIVAAVLANRAKKNESGKNDILSGLENGDVSVDKPENNLPIKPPKPEPPKLAPTFSVVPAENGLLCKGHDASLQVYSPTTGDYRVHIGIDLGTKENAPVFAAESGVVSNIWEDPMMGWCVAISHEGNINTYYKNLGKDMAEGIQTGVKVIKGQKIGTVGDSALIEVADEPHLHFEMTANGLSVNPLEYFTKDVLKSIESNNQFEDDK